ncbi:nucleoside hydrolase [Tunicatimonas pelagia]|uniref:nucleoside hydrolase n=1 Tax=Tunicatimonas pelagia TaxID=931531 RepID=UPI0026663441|nr:nucleoside hydrolase [Tunicatimonas pelagia]WKN45465.1 nucleoside hydrolase [Tunicatimonas pelagia]
MMKQRIGSILLALILIFYGCTNLVAQEKRKLIIDADTGNEVDDFYAVTRLLIDPSLEILALNATQWQASHWAVERSMEESYRWNIKLIRAAQKESQVKFLRGAEERMFDWGYKAQHSQATHHILQEAKKLDEEEKLDIMVLGALTNVASAVFIDPQIASRLRVYWLGTVYDFENDVFKKNDFNAVMDIQAVDVMLNSEVDMHIMPHSSAQPLRFNLKEVEGAFGASGLAELLIKRWKDHKGLGSENSTLWDLAIVAAYLMPEKFEPVSVKMSKENGNRTIKFYKPVNVELIKKDFFQAFALYEQSYGKH